MKKVVSIVLVFALAFSMAALSGCGSSDQVTLNVYNWGVNIADGTDEYIDVIALFEEKYSNIDVNYTTYEDNESLYTRLKNGGVSTRSSCFENEELAAENPSYPAQKEALEAANGLVEKGISWIPQVADSNALLDIAGKYGSDCLAGNISAQEACESMQTEMEDLLADS